MWETLWKCREIVYIIVHRLKRAGIRKNDFVTVYIKLYDVIALCAWLIGTKLQQ